MENAEAGRPIRHDWHERQHILFATPGPSGLATIHKTHYIIFEMERRRMVSWSVEILNEVVKAELGALPTDMRARFQRIVGLIVAHGLERVGEPHVKHLEGKLWEMRMTGRDGIARAIYIAASGRRVVVLRAFEKKTQKTPRSEITIAHERAKEVK